jgi:hypothetical protein
MTCGGFKAGGAVRFGLQIDTQVAVTVCLIRFFSKRSIALSKLLWSSKACLCAVRRRIESLRICIGDNFRALASGPIEDKSASYKESILSVICRSRLSLQLHLQTSQSATQPQGVIATAMCCLCEPPPPSLAHLSPTYYKLSEYRPFTLTPNAPPHRSRDSRLSRVHLPSPERINIDYTPALSDLLLSPSPIPKLALNARRRYPPARLSTKRLVRTAKRTPIRKINPTPSLTPMKSGGRTPRRSQSTNQA